MLVALHVLANLALRVHLDQTEHAWWLSNVCHAMTALALLLGSRSILSVSCCALLLPHTLWLTDALVGLTTGTFPIGITAHITSFAPALWFVTSYHFYLLPLLLYAVLHGRRFDARSALWTPALFAALLAFSTLLPAASNVNYAHALAPSLAWTAPINAWPHALYLVANWAAVTLIACAPAWCALAALSRTRHAPIALIAPTVHSSSRAA